MSAGDIAQLVGLLFAAVGLMFTGQQAGRARKQLALNAAQTERQRKEQRVAQIVHLHERLYDDPDLQAMYRMLERGWRYEPSAVPEQDGAGRGLEEQLDKLLGLFQVAAYLYRHDLLEVDELGLIAYEYLTVHQNPGVQDYLRLVEESNTYRGMDIQPVPDFRAVGDELQQRYRYVPIPAEWRRPPR